MLNFCIPEKKSHQEKPGLRLRLNKVALLNYPDLFDIIASMMICKQNNIQDIILKDEEDSYGGSQELFFPDTTLIGQFSKS